MGLSTKVRAAFDYLIEFYRPLPPLAYYTLLVLWFGIGEFSKILLLFLAAIPPMTIGAIVQYGGKILLTSEDMAKKGYATWDILSVQPEFAKKYPELVTKFIKTELRAIQYWRDHPEESAKIIAKELGGISTTDAKRMMDGTQLLDLSEQLSPQMFGTSAKKGNHVNEILNVATFLLDERRIKNPVTRKMAEDYIHPEFMEALEAEGFTTEGFDPTK